MGKRASSPKQRFGEEGNMKARRVYIALWPGDDYFKHLKNC